MKTQLWDKYNIMHRARIQYNASWNHSPLATHDNKPFFLSSFALYLLHEIEANSHP